MSEKKMKSQYKSKLSKIQKCLDKEIQIIAKEKEIFDRETEQYECSAAKFEITTKMREIHIDAWNFELDNFLESDTKDDKIQKTVQYFTNFVSEYDPKFTEDTIYNTKSIYFTKLRIRDLILSRL